MALKPCGGDTLCSRIGTPADLILKLVDEAGDITLMELEEKLEAREHHSAIGMLWRFFDRHQITWKKTALAAEQDCLDILMPRQAWFDGQLDLDPERLVFFEETWASTHMARRHGRRRGQRLRVGLPHDYWKTTPSSPS